MTTRLLPIAATLLAFTQIVSAQLNTLTAVKANADQTPRASSEWLRYGGQPLWVDPTTGRLLVDIGGSITVEDLDLSDTTTHSHLTGLSNLVENLQSQLTAQSNQLASLTAAVTASTNVTSTMAEGTSTSLVVDSPIPVSGVQGQITVILPMHTGSANTIGTVAFPPTEVDAGALSGTNGLLFPYIGLHCSSLETNNVHLYFSPYPLWSTATNAVPTLSTTMVATNPYVKISTTNYWTWDRIGDPGGAVTNVAGAYNGPPIQLMVNSSNKFVVQGIAIGHAGTAVTNSGSSVLMMPNWK